MLGPGGVGGFLAAALAHAEEDVVVVAREPTAVRIGEAGIDVKSVVLGDFTAHPRAVTRLEEPVDTLIVATKAGGLAPALERVADKVGLVVPLLNGLDHMDQLRLRFGSERVAAGAIRIESDRPGPATIVQTSRFLRVDLASDRPWLEGGVRALAAMLERAGVPARIERSEAQVLWSKLVRLNALALTTSASGDRIGFIRSDPRWRATLEACVAESVAVGRADGAELDASFTLAELDDAHAELGSSMQRDIAAGREPELDAIAGSVLRAAARHGLACPTVIQLAAAVAGRAGISAPAA